MSAKDQVRKFYVIGDPIEHSLSPLLHNFAYKALGLESEFSFSLRKVAKSQLGEAIDQLRLEKCSGFAVTLPHKESILEYLDNLSPDAREVGAVNTVVNQNGELNGYNTDLSGIVNPLAEITQLKGARVAIIGAGGAARAATYGLLKAGALVSIFNRTQRRAERLAKDFKGIDKIYSFERLEKLQEFEIILNTTSIGMGYQQELSPVPKNILRKNQIVFDIVYNPAETRLIQDAKEVGARVIYGLEMFLNQALEQIRLFTGASAPKDQLRAALENHLRVNDI